MTCKTTNGGGSSTLLNATNKQILNDKSKVAEISANPTLKSVKILTTQKIATDTTQQSSKISASKQTASRPQNTASQNTALKKSKNFNQPQSFTITE